MSVANEYIHSSCSPHTHKEIIVEILNFNEKNQRFFVEIFRWNFHKIQRNFVEFRKFQRNDLFTAITLATVSRHVFISSTVLQAFLSCHKYFFDSSLSFPFPEYSQYTGIVSLCSSSYKFHASTPIPK